MGKQEVVEEKEEEGKGVNRIRRKGRIVDE